MRVSLATQTSTLLLRKSPAPGLRPGPAEETCQAHHLSTHKELSEAMIGLARKLLGPGLMSPDPPQIAAGRVGVFKAAEAPTGSLSKLLGGDQKLSGGGEEPEGRAAEVCPSVQRNTLFDDSDEESGNDEDSQEAERDNHQSRRIVRQGLRRLKRRNNDYIENSEKGPNWESNQR